VEFSLQHHTSCALSVLAHIYAPVVVIKLFRKSLEIGMQSQIQQVEEVSLQRALSPAHFSKEVIALTVRLKRERYYQRCRNLTQTAGPSMHIAKPQIVLPLKYTAKRRRNRGLG
jgi:hypothetical protein